MGILTGLVEVDKTLFEKCEAAQKLKVLADVTSGLESPEILGLPKAYKFNSVYQDKGWDDIESLLEAIGVSSYLHLTGRKQINHDDMYICSYHPQQIWHILNQYLKAITEIDQLHHNQHNKELRGLKAIKIKQDKLAILPLESLSSSFELLEEYALIVHQNNPDSFIRHYWGDLMDEWHVKYVLEHLTQTIVIMTQALYEKDDDGHINSKENYIVWSQC